VQKILLVGRKLCASIMFFGVIKMNTIIKFREVAFLAHHFIKARIDQSAKELMIETEKEVYSIKPKDDEFLDDMFNELLTLFRLAEFNMVADKPFESYKEGE
jgi:hypothetical protein